jgi:hypothetical protein
MPLPDEDVRFHWMTEIIDGLRVHLEGDEQIVQAMIPKVMRALQEFYVERERFNNLFKDDANRPPATEQGDKGEK